MQIIVLYVFMKRQEESFKNSKNEANNFMNIQTKIIFALMIKIKILIRILRTNDKINYFIRSLLFIPIIQPVLKRA